MTSSTLEQTLWLVLCGGLMTVIGHETNWGQQLTLPLPQLIEEAPAFQAPVVVGPFVLPGPDQYLETSLRPIFISARRPAPATPAPEPPKPTMKRDQFILTGTTIVPEGKFAFLLERTTNRVRVVAEGKEINGIRVSEVRPERVTLSQFDESEVLTIRTARGTGLPGSPLPALSAPAPQVPSPPTATQPAVPIAPSLPLPIPAQGPAARPASESHPASGSVAEPTTPKPPERSTKPLGAGSSGTRFGP